MIFWYLQHATDSDEPAQVCILNTALMAQVCQASPLYDEWINFVSSDSNHNLEKGPFVYKFV